MNAYEAMIIIDRYLIQRESMTEEQKRRAANILFSAVSTKEEVSRFHAAVKTPKGQSGKSYSYPHFFIPPDKDRSKYKSLFNQTPKTHILAANIYELEILRLLNIIAAGDPSVTEMTAATLLRLADSCFGGLGCAAGECYDTMLVALRFIAEVAPHEIAWMSRLISCFRSHYGDRKRSWYNIWYFRLCLSEMPFYAALPEIEREKPDVLNWLKNKSCVMNSEHDREVHPVLLCILRNIMAKYPEYAYIKDRKPYINERDGRLYFDMSGN